MTSQDIKLGGGPLDAADPSGNSEITAAVDSVADQYATTLNDLLTNASGGSMDLAETTVLTTRVQQQQAILEMVQGVAKAATDQVKGLGKRIG
jgi:hypothetical protein